MPPFELGQGQSVYAKIRAYNERGWSDLSPTNAVGTVIEVEPIFMAPPQRGTGTTTTQININWDTIGSPQDGDSPVTSYSMEWDVGSNGLTWVREIGYLSNSLLTSFTVTDNILIGHAYQFRLRAKNIWGWGAYSEVVIIKAARIPEQMTAPATSVDSETGDFVISWTQPDQ